MRFYLGVLLALLAVQLTFACEVIDDAGQTIRLDRPALRIVSLAPDITETLFAAGAGQHIVGVMQGSDYPAAAKKILIIGSSNRIDSEAILRLQPDLLVTWNAVKIPAVLKNRGIPIYTSHIKKITDVPRMLRNMGCLAGTEAIADSAADQFMQRYMILKHRYAHATKISVFYEVWSRPLLTITKESWIDDVIVLCGGVNPFANLKGQAPEIDREALMRAHPDVIIEPGTLDADFIERAGPRLIDGAEMLCQRLDKIRAAK